MGKHRTWRYPYIPLTTMSSVAPLGQPTLSAKETAWDGQSSYPHGTSEEKTGIKKENKYEER